MKEKEKAKAIFIIQYQISYLFSRVDHSTAFTLMHIHIFEIFWII